ncbi:MAG TPA: GGDEF domain-containing protein [Holophagaceae bacterium]|nr:GGDEF domain-containing protein [Holophagaceae bacterium]
MASLIWNDADDPGGGQALLDALLGWGYRVDALPSHGTTIVVAGRPRTELIPPEATEVLWWVVDATPEEASEVLNARPGWVLRRGDPEAARAALRQMWSREGASEDWLRQMVQQTKFSELLRLVLDRAMTLAQAEGGGLWVRRDETFFQRAGDGSFPEAPLPREAARSLVEAGEAWWIAPAEQMGILRLKAPKSPPEVFLGWSQDAEPLLLGAWRLEESRLLSFKDDLTVAQNRRCLEVELPKMVRDAAAAGESLALLFFDVDNLKALNSEHGHMAGSLMLRTVADGAHRICRAHDRLYRYGGDEFCILMPRTHAVGAAKLGERLLAVLQEAPLLIDGEWVPVSLSVGIAAFPEHAAGAEALLATSDKALMEAKRAGKHRVVVAR